jgi:peptidoglycan/xylan/chitin deacetylase (PgdA/CDA1 family)
MSRRQRLADFLERSGLLSAVMRLRDRSPVPWLSVLTYHQFPSNGGVEPFDDGVVDVTPEEFERQIIGVKKHFNVVGVAELCAFAQGRPLPKNPVAITFDDGYLSNFETALPILKKHDCKAMFFVATSLIEERRIHWWDRIAYVIKTSPRRELQLEFPVPMHLDLTGPREDAIRAVLRVVKIHPSLPLQRFLSEMSRAADVPWSAEVERRFADRLLMTWDQVRELRKAGMDVQSHTRNHRVLQTLTQSELRDELDGSRDDLRRALGEAPRAIAYPVGHPLGATSPVRTALEKSGYEIGLTNGTGPTPLDGTVDRFDIRRQMTGRDVSNAFFLTILAMPGLAPTHLWRLPANLPDGRDLGGAETGPRPSDIAPPAGLATPSITGKATQDIDGLATPSSVRDATVP